MSTSETPLNKHCSVCGAAPAGCRYGVMSCGACALFFRRSVNSNRLVESCECSKKGTRYICRFCRMNKCLEAGMKISMVKFKSENQKFDQSNETLPVLPVMRVNDNIIEKSSDRLESLQVHFDNFNQQREFFKELGGNAGKWNIFEISCMISRDFEITRKFHESTQSELKALSNYEKDAIFTSSYPTSNLFEIITLADKNTRFLVLREMSLDRYYYRPDKTFGVAENDLMRTFAPFWEYFGTYFKKPVLELKLDQIEIAFILSLRLLDSGSSHLSEKSMELCRTLKKIILRELRSYYIVMGIEEKRLYDVLEIPVLMEKADEKLYNQFLLYELHGVKLDDGFRRIFSFPKL